MGARDGRARRLIARGVALSLVLSASITLAAGTIASSHAAAAQTDNGIEAAAGQFVPIVRTKILDTRSGVGTGGVVATIAPGASVLNVPVEGVGSIPSSGVSAVFINIQVLTATASGSITDYGADVSNPGHASLSYLANQATSGSDVVDVAAPGTDEQGDISFTNNSSSATISLAAAVEGYYTDDTATTPGDTYVSEPWTAVVNTATGVGTPGNSTAPLAAGATLQFDPLGFDGVPASDVDAVQLEVGAMNNTVSSYLQFNASDGAPPLRSLSFTSGQTNRVTDVLQPNSSGELSITNEGWAPVTLQVTLRGYYLNSTASEAGGSYVGMVPATVCDTRSSCVYNGVNRGALAAGASMTIPETGVAGIPSSGVAEVANEINVVSPGASGWLSVDAAGTGTPTSLSMLNFTTNNAAVAFDASQLSSSGAISVTNHSGSTVQIVVSVRGFWQSPTVPAAPGDVDSYFDGTDANITWNWPTSDGGATITGYTISLSDGTQATAASDATSISLPAVSGDTFTVGAINGMGTGALSAPLSVLGQTWTSDDNAALNAQDDTSGTPMSACAGEPSPIPSGTVSGTLVDPSGDPIANDEVDVTVDDSSLASPQYPSLGSVQSDSNGCWWYTLPTSWPASPDPLSEVPGLLSADSDTLNLQVSADATATVDGVTYPEYGTAETPDDIDAGGNASAVSVQIQVFPVSSSSGQQVAKAPSRASVLTRAERLVINQRRLGRAIARAEANQQGPDTNGVSAPLQKNAYGIFGGGQYDPFDVNGVNLQTVRSAPASPAELVALLPHSANAHYRGSTPSVGSTHVGPHEWKGPSGVSCFANPNPDVASTCEPYCVNGLNTIASQGWAMEPSGLEAHPFAPGEIATLTDESGSASSHTIDVTINGGAGSLEGGFTHEDFADTSDTKPVKYQGGAYKELLVSTEYTGRESDGECISVGIPNALLPSSGPPDLLSLMQAFDVDLPPYLHYYDVLPPMLANGAPWSYSEQEAFIKADYFDISNYQVSSIGAQVGRDYPTCNANPNDVDASRTWGGATSAQECAATYPDYKKYDGQPDMLSNYIPANTVAPSGAPGASTWHVIGGDGDNWACKAQEYGNYWPEAPGGTVASSATRTTSHDVQYGLNFGLFGLGVTLSYTTEWSLSSTKTESIQTPPLTAAQQKSEPSAEYWFWGQQASNGTGQQPPGPVASAIIFSGRLQTLSQFEGDCH